MHLQPERLRFALMRRQRSRADLARSLNVTPKTIQRYEQGGSVPSDATLQQLAIELRFPVAFFTDPDPLPDIANRALSFRAYSKMSAGTRDNATAIAKMAVRVADWLGTVFELPELDVPDLSESAAGQPDTAARLLRDAWALGRGPIANAVHLLEARGVRVFSLPEEVADVDAFCFWYGGSGAYVVLNLQKSAERGRFDAGHELGHLVLHRHVDFTRDKRIECEADAFAAEFLMPSESLHAQMPSTVTLATVMELKRHWGVSAMAMAKRLKDIGRLSEWVYRGMCMDLAKRGYRKSEPGGMAAEVSSVLADALTDLRESGHGVADVAGALKVDRSDILPMLFWLPGGPGRPFKLVQGGKAT